MNTRTICFSLMFIFPALVSAPLNAQPFNSGSTGVYGPLNITSNTTLDLPADGIFNCTTISVAANATLTFNRNPLNTPVYLLAIGDVQITGIIDVSGSVPAGGAPGSGGPGGFDGGFGGVGVGSTAQGGDGQGPGAGRNLTDWQYAVFGAPIRNNSNTYGNVLLSPLIGGSGGAGNDGNPGGSGGGGGGAILIASNTRVTIDGAIYANGAIGSTGSAGYGSGGGIRIVAPLVNGKGNLQGTESYFGPTGRIRIDCLDRVAFRSLKMEAGTVTRGSRMFVFPAVIPRLDIIKAAGQAIPEGAPNGVQVELPVGSPTDQTVVVQARNFTGLVPINVVVTPENGPSASYAAQIDMSSGNPAQTTVNIVIPAGILSHLSVWTR